VAVFERTSVVMGQTLTSPLAGGLAIASNVFSADLIESSPFTLDGERHDFRDLLPHGITQWGTMNANPLASSRRSRASPLLPARPWRRVEAAWAAIDNRC
jgi:hypothetical protein